jgi:hypothetical protein
MNTSFEHLHSQLIFHHLPGRQSLIPNRKNMSSILVSWQGREHVVALAQEDTLRDIGLKIAEATGTSLETLKLLQGGRVVVPARAPDDRAVDAGAPAYHFAGCSCMACVHGIVSIHCTATFTCMNCTCCTELLLLPVTGLQPNSRVRLLASAAHDVAAVRSARDMPGLAGLEHESQRAAARRRTAGGADVTLPTGSSPLASCALSWEPSGRVLCMLSPRCYIAFSVRRSLHVPAVPDVGQSADGCFPQPSTCPQALAPAGGRPGHRRHHGKAQVEVREDVCAML